MPSTTKSLPASGLKRVAPGIDWIVTSPFLRAAETAQIVAEGLQSHPPLDFCDDLRPGENAEKLLLFLGKKPERTRILLVGHEPDLSDLAGRLIGAGPHANLLLKKGGCCLITSEHLPPKLPGQLVWWMTPRMLRSLA